MSRTGGGNGVKSGVKEISAYEIKNMNLASLSSKKKKKDEAVQEDTDEDASNEAKRENSESDLDPDLVGKALKLAESPLSQEIIEFILFMFCTWSFNTNYNL